MQIQADIIGISVERPQMRESTALGSAIAAGLAVGIYKSMDDLKNVNQLGMTEFKPENDEKDRAKRYKLWNKAVERAVGWLNDDEEEDDA
jgi:glycerol kinase